MQRRHMLLDAEVATASSHNVRHGCVLLGARAVLREVYCSICRPKHVAGTARDPPTNIVAMIFNDKPYCP